MCAASTGLTEQRFMLQIASECWLSDWTLRLNMGNCFLWSKVFENRYTCSIEYIHSLTPLYIPNVMYDLFPKLLSNSQYK